MLQLVPKTGKPSFQDFYEDNYSRVVLYIQKKITNHHNAEDLAGEIFLYCYSHYDDYDPDKASLSTWLYMIVNSRIKNYYRDAREHVDLDAVSPFLPDENSEMENAIYLEQASAQLHRAISRLPLRQQQIVKLYYFEERSSVEIAKIMGLTAVNVRVQLSRALDKLEIMCSDIMEGVK